MWSTYKQMSRKDIFVSVGFQNVTFLLIFKVCDIISLKHVILGMHRIHGF